MRKFALSFTVIAALFGSSIAQTEVKVEHRLNDHANPNSEAAARTAAAPTAGSTSATSALLPHTGPVINTPTIYIIWYGNWNQTNGTDNPAGQQIIRDWAAGIGSSDYFRINSTYSAKPVSGQAIFGQEYTYPNATSTRLTDSNILTIVSNSIGSGKLPYNAGGIYFVVTSSNIAESSGFCSRYCGWHTAGTASAGHVRYSFVGNAARCLSSCAAQSVSPNGNAGVDGAISVLSHELEEATTDPDLNAWYDSSGAENGDKCAWTFGNTTHLANGSYANMSFNGRNWLIQRNLRYSGSSWFCADSYSGSQTGVFN